MLKSKDGSIKIIDPIEDKWIKAKESTIEDIERQEFLLIFQKSTLKMIEEKIDEFKKTD